MITSKNYRRTISDMIKADGKQAERVQGVTEFAFEQAALGQLTPLTEVYEAVVQMRSVNTNLWKDYVKAHVSNIMLANDKKTGSNKYKKAKKGESIEVQAVTVLFVDYQREKAEPTTPKRDLSRSAQTLIDNMLAARKGEVVLKSELSAEKLDKALELAQQLADLLA